MSQIIEYQLTCPQCSTEFSHPAHTLVDMADEADSEVLWQLQNSTLNKVECPMCRAEGLIPVPVVLHNPEQQMVLVFTPGAQMMDERQLGEAIGPVLQTFIESRPPDARAEYMLTPVVTDDLDAIQQAARGELTAADLMDDGPSEEIYGDAGDDEDEDDEELTAEEQQQITERVSLVQQLLSVPPRPDGSDSFDRINLMRTNKGLLDEIFLDVVSLLSEQVQAAQPELMPMMKKIMNEAEVFISANA